MSAIITMSNVRKERNISRMCIYKLLSNTGSRDIFTTSEVRRARRRTFLNIALRDQLKHVVAVLNENWQQFEDTSR